MEKSANKLRVFVDANILLSGNAFPRWPYEVLQHALNREIHLVLSPLVIREAREHIEKLFPQHLARLDRFFENVEYELVPDPTTEEVIVNKRLVRDVADVPVALSAINAKVDYMVSEDKGLSEQNETTAELHKHVNVLISGTFLRVVMGWTSDQLEAVRGRKWSDIFEVEQRSQPLREGCGGSR